MAILLIVYAFRSYLFSVYLVVANYLTIAALVFLSAKVGEQSEMIFHWLIFLLFSTVGVISVPYHI